MAEEIKFFKCAKCGKEKNREDGTYVLEGTTFCCKECCGKPDEKDSGRKKDSVCEFC